MKLNPGASMQRRKFIAFMGAAAAWPLRAYAQSQKVSRVGALVIGNADLDSFQKELREGLRELGHIEGQNIRF
jgi:putative ABC transport system substrate-binding protein